MTALNPLYTIGDQIAEVLKLHQGLSKRQCRNRTIEMLAEVQIPAPEIRVDAYPHQLSGGMRQRVMIVMALACRPRLLIADEPTTALDVTVQAQIFDLLRQLQHKTGVAILLITHNLASIADIADDMAVLYAGRCVERGAVKAVLDAPLHPYTQSLLAGATHLRVGPSAMQKLEPAEIPGIVPGIGMRGEYCTFAPRCRYAADACFAAPPPLADAGERHFVACQRSPAEPAEFVRSCSVTGTTPLNEEIENNEVLLQVRHLSVRYPVRRSLLPQRRKMLHAVDDISFDVMRQSIFGIVGESGSGKSTTAQAIMRLIPHAQGSIILDGTDISALQGLALRSARRRFQMIFQDPFSALNPRHRAGDIIGEPLELLHLGAAQERKERVSFLLNAVGMPPEAAQLFPHQFSGGQRQRLMIARTLSTSPDIVICDEPVSALDVASQAQILNMLKRLQLALGLTFVFISHDLGTVQYICDHVAVMYLGQIVEYAPSKTLFTAPRHPYTWGLIAAALPSGPLRRKLKQRFSMAGEPLSPIDPPAGCRLALRCTFAETRCREESPVLMPCGQSHFAACHRMEDAAAEGDLEQFNFETQHSA